MYTGKIEKFDYDTCYGLLVGAEKYQVGHLKNVCKEFMMKNLNVENAIETLKLCKLFPLEDLEKYVEIFVKQNAKLIYQRSPVFNESEAKAELYYLKVINAALSKTTISK